MEQFINLKKNKIILKKMKKIMNDEISKNKKSNLEEFKKMIEYLNIKEEQLEKDLKIFLKVKI